MNRGQAAMEFISSYGWALVVVLVSLSTLAYFGLFDTGRFIPNTCFFETGIDCVDYRLNDGGLTFGFYNNFGRKLYDVNITVITNYGDCNESVYIGIVPNTERSPAVDFCTDKTFPGKVSGKLFLEFTFEDEVITHVMPGTFALRKE
ncbi:hypothetical protein GOV07_01490 [Candidatus Woesearchaeota archaeon]|nr:hypothetical protein [Candidatus Woesearchaeota archaeon]